MNRYSHILGCLLGTAVGDAVGLRREGLSRRRAKKMYGGSPLQPNLLLGRGMCSDDTEHMQMVGCALVCSMGDVGRFERQLAGELKRWLLTAPAGVGLATLRACLKLVLGFGPRNSGVFSAGNGPAMRSALIGLFAESESQLRKLVHASTRLTHTDPKAEEGALLVALAARLTIAETGIEPIEFIEQSCKEIEGDELRDGLQAIVTSLSQQKTPTEFADSRGWSRGISGYVNQTVPTALYCWAYSPTDFRQSVENAVLLGGDTDSVAAITGAISGANLGDDVIPAEWINRIVEWPRTVDWTKQLAEAVSKTVELKTQQSAPSMRWLATLPRNLIFAVIVLGIGFRRLLPPY